jgi:Uma2 family endonuclease
MGRFMAQTAKRAATYEDLLSVPEPLVAEILFGELVTHPRPAAPHVITASALGHVLGSPFQAGIGGPGGWIFADKPELHLGEHVVVPDLAAWRIQRLSALPTTAWFGVAPDWVCELLSPSTERYDRGDKRLIYAEANVAHAWYVNPVLRMLEAYELREGKWVTLDVFFDDEEVKAPPFTEVSFSANRLWPLDPPAEEQG